MALDQEVVTILSQLEGAGTSRLVALRPLRGQTSEDQVFDIIDEVRSTILPRKLVFHKTGGAKMALIAGSGRLLRVDSVHPADLPQGNFTSAMSRESRVNSVAEAICAFAHADGNLSLEPLFLDEELAAENVGFTSEELYGWVADNGVEVQKNPLHAQMVLGFDGEILEQVGDVSLFPSPEILDMLLKETSDWRKDFSVMTGTASCVIVPQLNEFAHTVAIYLTLDAVTIQIYAGSDITPVAKAWQDTLSAGQKEQ